MPGQFPAPRKGNAGGPQGSPGPHSRPRLIQPLRVSDEDEELGLDESQHNEKYMQGTLLVGDKPAYIEKNNPLEESYA